MWNSQWHGGFSWDDSGLKFNWHPVLMVSGLVVVYGFGEYGSLGGWEGGWGLVVVYGFGEYGVGLTPSSKTFAFPPCRVGIPEQGT